MAEDQFPLFTNCRLTINSKVASGSGTLYKLLTDELKFKIVGCGPLVIEKDDPSQDDIEKVFDGIRSLCDASVSRDQTVKQNVQCNMYDVTNSASESQTGHMIGEHYQLVSRINNAYTEGVKEDRSCKESQCSTTAVSENFNLTYKEDITSEKNIPLNGTDKEKQAYRVHDRTNDGDEKLGEVTKEQSQRDSEPFNERLLHFATLDAVVKETDQRIIKESAAEYLVQMTNSKELEQTKRSNISNEDVESKQEVLMQDTCSSQHSSTPRDSENIKHVPAGYSSDKHKTKDTNSLSVGNKISDILQTAYTSTEGDQPYTLAEDDLPVWESGDCDRKIIKGNRDYETTGKLHQAEGLLCNKSSLCSKLNLNGTTDAQNMEKIDVEEQSQDNLHVENTADCSTTLMKSADQQMCQEQFENMFISEMSAETNMSEEIYMLSNEISRIKEEDINSSLSPIVSGTHSDNTSVYCVVSNVCRLNIQVYKADITELQVDCIVNAANENLMHIGGVAKAISDAAGSALRKECDSYTKNGRALDVADIFVSTGGKLPAKYVIHAVGPRWDSYDKAQKRQCFTDLRHTVIKCLVEANRRRLTSVALPSISAAIFGVPKEQCARCYMEAVKHFDVISVGDRLNLQEIHFVDVDDTMVDMIATCFSSSWSKLTETDIVLKDAKFVEQYLKSASENEMKDRHGLSVEGIKCASDKSKLSSVLAEDVAGAAALTTSQHLVDHLSRNQDCSSRLNSDQSVSQSAAALTDETCDISAAYRFGNITLHVDSRHAFDIKSNVTFTLGKPFDKLSATRDFSITTSLQVCERSICQENKYTYFKVSQLDGSQSGFLCEVFPEPDEVETITKAFGNLELALQSCKQLPTTLIITSSVLYADPSNIQQQKRSRNNLNVKNIARFAASLYDYLDKVSKDTHKNVSVFVVGSEDSLPAILKVIESHNVMKIVPTIHQGASSMAREPSPHGSQVYSGQRSGYAVQGASYTKQHREEVHQGASSMAREPSPHGSQVYSGQRSGYAVQGASYTKQHREEGVAATVHSEHACDFCGQNRLCERVTCCGKWLCQDCEQNASTCPFCLKLRKIITGNQPPGFMTVSLIDDCADGYENTDTWEIEYYFRAGVQTECHPHPGKKYDAVKRLAYIPNNSQGFQVLLRLRLAFIRNLIFTVGYSNSRDKDDVIVWDGISHKTRLNGKKKYGYPDPDYLSWVTLELTNKGVQLTTATETEKKQLSEFVYCLKSLKSFSDM